MSELSESEGEGGGKVKVKVRGRWSEGIIGILLNFNGYILGEWKLRPYIIDKRKRSAMHSIFSYYKFYIIINNGFTQNMS